ncbi:THUMP domain-containing class I SAM-dependent RNA methyltransferase [Thetidibacter halocola]|uniref:Class I SAM-dependent RNA methyltransferase n=1 Tax=Thetidibacter halocola TaxID=2827239 RepID=A0A8J7WHJ5_9RHOB|nr:class I SAM-dependent RNA methyltransferase [Thetidibacter halocola]MBS0125453.1 class I SAM-dependent RNA methyltransferase [Thetidibacter halocola]
MESFEIFLAAQPGLEGALLAEVREAGFAEPVAVPGGVTLQGSWPDVWRANLVLRGAGRVLARIASFRAMHLAQLDKRARKVDWAAHLRPDLPVRVEATCRQSKIYHDRAARQRIERAIAETVGAPIAEGEDAPIRVMLRIEDDLAVISLDTSGEPLHRRGHKTFVGKAPMRETLAALFLREAGFDGTEPLVDPMCGSGTFVLEAAEVARGLLPGRSRSFAFETFGSFDPAAFAAMKAVAPRDTDLLFHGSDRDDGAIRGAVANAERAGVADLCRFTRAPVGALQRPDGPPGLVMVNPPYGERIGNRKLLFALYGSLGAVLKERFSGWRVGIVTSDGGLAKATGLPFGPAGPPVAHGGLTVKLWLTGPLG